MARTAGSRNKKFSVPRRLEDELDRHDLAQAREQVEEKFSEIAPLPDQEKLKNFLDTYTTTLERPQRGGSVKAHKDKMDTPDYLNLVPEGEEREKAVKAAAQAALLLGTPASQVALQYGLPHATVAQWEGVLLTAGAVGRRDRLTDMLLTFIEQELKSLMAISIVTSNESWIKRQNADQLAHYVAVKSDRLMAMLAAFNRAAETRNRYMEKLEVIEQHANR